MELTKEIFDFIEKSPSPYHAVGEVKETLKKHGYTELYENAQNPL